MERRDGVLRKLTERERSAGRLPEGFEYTLPTEAQWEYACRAGTTEDFAGGLEAMAWYDQNSGSTTHPAGQKQPNAWELYDMHGNVGEWCRDWYQDHLSGGSVADPIGPALGSARVVRGGDWHSTARDCRSADRYRVGPGIRFNVLGFRLALCSVPERRVEQAVAAREPATTAVNVEPDPTPGAVACETTPAGARVVINGGDQHGPHSSTARRGRKS